jgi:alkanesulfonate monooxygenase SsuD/methylene tetrahydromethanopterin reductase-like flavin-dependent oxidoreductase (luciferase family)
VTRSPLAHGSVSLRLYPHPLAPAECVAELCAQAALAERAGFDGVMTSEHHGGFPGYLPNPLQAAGWALESTRRAWAAPAPLLLPLRHWSHVAEDLAWMASRFPGRVGGGFAIGGLARDFEMADLRFDEKLARFEAALPRLVEALRGRALPPLGEDPAVAACAEHPIPMLIAARSPGAARRAARLGVGVLYDSLQTAEGLRRLSDAYAAAGGEGPRIGIRRVWLGPPPRLEVERQMDFYRAYAPPRAQRQWGAGEELVSAEGGAALAERLDAFAGASGCDALDLRVHFTGVEPARVREQIERIGAEVLPGLRERLAARVCAQSP